MAVGSSAAAETADRVLVITRVFDAPRSFVFQAWTEPELHAISSPPTALDFPRRTPLRPRLQLQLNEALVPLAKVQPSCAAFDNV
jgi:hypothetical protein